MFSKKDLFPWLGHKDPGRENTRLRITKCWKRASVRWGEKPQRLRTDIRGNCETAGRRLTGKLRCTMYQLLGEKPRSDWQSGSKCELLFTEPAVYKTMTERPLEGSLREIRGHLLSWEEAKEP